MEIPQNQQLTRPSENSYLSKILREYPKIRSLKNFVPIDQAIARCVVLVGIPPSNYPGELEKQILIDFVVKTYPGYVAPEIIKAFEMAINREFHDVDYDQLLKHYGTFSAEYLGRIMSVYTEQHRNKVLSLKANVTPMYKQPEFDRLANFELGLFQKFDKFKETKKFDMFPETAAHYYNELREMGLLESTKEERQEYGRIARERTPQKRDKAGRIIETTKQHESRIIACAKALMLHEWFKGEAMSDTNIRRLISPLLNKTK